MLAIAAAVCFAAAFVEHGGKVTVTSQWFGQASLLYLGLALLAVHCVRWPGPGNRRSG